MTKNLTGRVFARLLHLANSHPPAFNRAEFYAMKDDLLKRYGTFDGRDIQRVVKECWGVGWWDGGDYVPCGPKCSRCGGTGVYETKYFELQRCRMGGFLFHSNPTRLYFSDRHAHATIEGRIEHKDYGRAADEAMLWLTLLTGRWGLFWNETKATWRYGRKLWPLLNLGCLCWFVYSFYSGLRVYRCRCGGSYRQWWLSKGHWCVCRKCRNSRPEEIPF